MSYSYSYGKILIMATYHTTISSKGQVIIPAELRERHGLTKGISATWSEQGGRLVLTPVKHRIREMRGCLKPTPGAPTMFDALFAEREKERKREK